jgi:hypothetical protein
MPRPIVVFLLELPTKTHIVNDAAAHAIMQAWADRQPAVTIPIEINGEGSGAWNVTINTAQVIQLVEQRGGSSGLSFDRRFHPHPVAD